MLTRLLTLLFLQLWPHRSQQPSFLMLLISFFVEIFPLCSLWVISVVSHFQIHSIFPLSLFCCYFSIPWTLNFLSILYTFHLFAKKLHYIHFSGLLIFNVLSSGYYSLLKTWIMFYLKYFSYKSIIWPFSTNLNTIVQKPFS